MKELSSEQGAFTWKAENVIKFKALGRFLFGRFFMTPWHVLRRAERIYMRHKHIFFANKQLFSCGGYVNTRI